MTKRVLTDEECNEAFARLETNLKRRILEDALREPCNPAMFRDILKAHVIPRLDLVSFEALRATCRAFRNWFDIHPDLLKIQRYLETLEGEEPKQEMAKHFFDCAIRFQWLMRKQSPQFEVQLEKFTRDKYYNSTVSYVKTSAYGFIQYPSGFICRERRKPQGCIFEANPMRCAFKYWSEMSKEDKEIAHRWRRHFFCRDHE